VRRAYRRAIRIEGHAATGANITDEQEAELHEKFALCLPGIRRILSRIYEVGSEQDDKITVEWWLGSPDSEP
jgi:hypothetical protein